MSLSFHIGFNGQCEEAFRFYAAHLVGSIGTLLRGRDAPGLDPSDRHGDKIVHANIRIDGVEIAGADVAPEQYVRPRGCFVLLGVESVERVQSVFDALSPSGEVIFAPQQTFWSPCYAIVVDRFGVPWKIQCGT